MEAPPASSGDLFEVASGPVVESGHSCLQAALCTPHPGMLFFCSNPALTIVLLRVPCLCNALIHPCRVNMHAIEVTIQNLIGSGMDPKTENNPYLGFVYTSFQERATKVRRLLLLQQQSLQEKLS
jgi:hypothetical protein